METIKAFESIKPIIIENPVDKIIKQIKDLISTGQLNPGDRLPAERILAEMFGVGRGYIREAILKLEFYGLLKTSPQSGTYVSGFSLKIMDGILSDIVSFNKGDFASLIEARYYIEIDAVKLAAERRTQDDIKAMLEAVDKFDTLAKKNESAVQEDILFHKMIASSTKNTVLESIILILVPDLIKEIVSNCVSQADRFQSSVKEHRNILNAIIKKDTDAAGAAMALHLKPSTYSQASAKLIGE